MFSTVFSLLLTAAILAGNRTVLRFLFGNVEEDVMDACVTYLRISAYSYPALAVYNAGAAICRSLGKTKVTMNISIISNIINVIGNTIGIFVLHAGVAGAALGPVYITVIGQCMGAKDTGAAEYYFRKLTKITLTFSVVWNLFVFLITPVLLRFYNMQEETVALTVSLVIVHNIFNAVAFPFSGCLGNGLRAAGDVSFTMIVSIASTICVRLLLSWIFSVVFSMGVMGIAFAMCADWVVRAVFFILRTKSGVWKTKKVI